MGIRKGARPIVERMRVEIERAGKPLSAAELSDRIGITLGHAVSECRRQVVARNMHVALIDYCGGRRPKYFFGAGPAPVGHKPDVVGEPKKAPSVEKTVIAHQQVASFGRYASVWDYAEGRTR